MTPFLHESDSCSLCGQRSLRFCYRPEGSRRVDGVYVCGACGLVQSLPRVASVGGGPPAVSAGANWGNIRYGKEMALPQALELLDRVVDWGRVGRILDVGSNRGHFVRAAAHRAPRAEIWAVEPDTRIVDDYAELGQTRFFPKPIERVDLPSGRFDLIYCSHTLEHVADPLAVMKQLRTALSEEGVFYVEVPGIAFLDRDDVVEEWFIDKHLYHFSWETLHAMAATAGLQPIEEAGLREGQGSPDVIGLFRRAPEGATPFVQGDDPLKAEARIRRYARTRKTNLKALRAAARRLETLCAEGPVACWGAGRLFDLMVTAGGLNPRRLAAVVDRYLHKYVDQVHGTRVLPPEALKQIQPRVVVAMSREYAEEIRAEASRIVPGASVLPWAELMGRAGRASDPPARESGTVFSSLPNPETTGLAETALWIRRHALAAIYRAGSGHPGGVLSCADLLAYLVHCVLEWPQHRPDDPHRPRFVLSKGHACPVLYAAAALCGWIPLETLGTLRKLNSPLQGHPHTGTTPWVDASTGSLGQGFSVAMGMALGFRHRGRSTPVYVMLGDGELQEGIVWETAMCAAHYGLHNLCAVVDYNKMQSDDYNENVMGLEPLSHKWKAFGWNVLEIDGHDFQDISDAFTRARSHTESPTVIIAHTIKGKGVSFMEGSPVWHGSVKLKQEELVAALRDLDTPEEAIRAYLEGRFDAV